MHYFTCLLLVCFHSVGLFQHSVSDNVQEGTSLEANKLTRINFEDSVRQLYNNIGLEQYDLSYDVFRYSMVGFYSLKQEGKLNNKNILTIIDFSKSSTKKRFYTIDIDQQRILYNTYVSHGKNTGEDMAKQFSNTVYSNQSSLGFYITAETYIGSKGYSLKLDGADKGYNDNMRERAVVMHAADYVSERWIKANGRLGRSQGCPALPVELSKEIIDVVKNGTAIFAYYQDEKFLNSSAYLNTNKLMQNLEREAELLEASLR
jgi:hypothetical protein